MNAIIFGYDASVLPLIPIEHMAVVKGEDDCKVTLWLKDIEAVKRSHLERFDSKSDEAVEIHFSNLTVHLDKKYYNNIMIG